MNTYEDLEHEAFINGVDVMDYDFDSDNIKGLYCDGVIGINKNIKGTAERSLHPRRRAGHHYTSSGNILDQNKDGTRKTGTACPDVGVQ